MECNCFNVKNDIIYSYYNKFRLCCVEKYIRINDTFNLIPFEIRYKDILHFKNAEAIYYRGKIILVHKNYNIKEHKKNFNIQTPEIFNFINNPKNSLNDKCLKYADYNIIKIEKDLVKREQELVKREKEFHNMKLLLPREELLKNIGVDVCDFKKTEDICERISNKLKELEKIDSKKLILQEFKQIVIKELTEIVDYLVCFYLYYNDDDENYDFGVQSQVLISMLKTDKNKLKNKLNKKTNQILNLSKKLNNLNNELSKKDKLNKRLVNLLTIYKYHELNNVQKYDYQEIKEKNKKLNQEFKRVAKLMKLNK